MTSKVTTYRQMRDRPPRQHGDMYPCAKFPQGWFWDYYTTLRHEDVPFSPCAVPKLGTKWAVRLGEDGRALAPPACWEKFVVLQGPAYQAIKGGKGKGKDDKGKGKDGKGKDGNSGHHFSWKGKGKNH